MHYLRTLADARRLRAALVPGRGSAIVGAGFIGLEVAATAQRAGAEVTVIEALPDTARGDPRERGRALVRRLPPRAGGPDAARRDARGRPRERLGRGARPRGRRAARTSIASSSGSARRRRPSGCAAAGSTVAGVRTDTAGRTGLPDVFAAGDAAASFDPRIGEHARAEHWDAAAWQGAAAATAMLGEAPGTPAAAQLLERSARHAHPLHRPRGPGRRGPLRGRGGGARLRRRLSPGAPSPWPGSRSGARGRFPKLRREIERGHFPASPRQQKARAA